MNDVSKPPVMSLDQVKDRLRNDGSGGWSVPNEWTCAHLADAIDAHQARAVKPAAYFIETSPGNWDQVAALYAGQPGVVPLFAAAPVAEPAPPVEFDRAIETTRRQQAVEKLLAMRWTYDHENGWTAPTVEQAGEVMAWRIDWDKGADCGSRVVIFEPYTDKPIPYGYRKTPLYAAQPRPVGVPDGWKIVPIISTLEMELAGGDALVEGNSVNWQAEQVWKAMLAAAPAPGKGGEA